jgi:hypothetical protein
MPHSYGASLAEVGRWGASIFEAANDMLAKTIPSTIIKKIGR